MFRPSSLVLKFLNCGRVNTNFIDLMHFLDFQNYNLHQNGPNELDLKLECLVINMQREIII